MGFPLTVATVPGPSALLAAGDDACLEQPNAATNSVNATTIAFRDIMLVIAPRVSILWAVSVDAYCMYIRLHQIAEGSIYHTVPRKWLGAREPGRDDPHPEVASAVACSGVAGMSLAVIDYFQEFGGECIFEPRSNSRDAIAHDSTCTTGFISTSANTFSTT
jgi:hypothetical protein